MKQAFIIRCAPSGISRIDEILKAKQIVIGWSLTTDKLFDKNLSWEEFKDIIKTFYVDYENNPYSLGQGAGYLWRFIRDMQIGDYALVPISGAFYLGEITSEVICLKNKVDDDTAIRRNVNWLNNGNPISREYCEAGLISRLKYQGTCVGATDLISSIENALKYDKEKRIPTFKQQMNESLKEQIKQLLISPKATLSPDKFEDLILQLLNGLGAVTEKPSKNRYPNSIADVDVIASFVHLGLQIYVQAKKHNHISDEHAINQVIAAMQFDNPHNSKGIFGWAVTSGNFSDTALELANKNGIRCIDGDELSEMILSIGLEKFKFLARESRKLFSLTLFSIIALRCAILTARKVQILFTT
ncbi:MAG: restriction endonuclease [Bacteroidota bacterium]